MGASGWCWDGSGGGLGHDSMSVRDVWVYEVHGGTRGGVWEVQKVESDGQSAQHKVDTEEAREQAKGARRGPSNASMQHFHEPVAVMDKKKGARWEFKCRYCECVERTVKGPKVSFDDEGKLPKLNNLATHSNECRGKSKPQERSDEGNRMEQSTAEGLNLKRSADLMRNYLKDGELNPEALTTERGFLRLFAAWILDEYLPWTTGEAPSLRLLFKYLKVHYMLPSDTTVRNQLTKIFAELNAKVVKSFTVLTTDNASVNNVLVATVARCVLACYGVEWNPDGHIRCIAHVINLTVQDLLASMDEAEWSSNVNYYELNKDAPFHYSVDEDVKQIALEAEGDSEQVDGEEDVEIGTAIQKEEVKKKKTDVMPWLQPDQSQYPSHVVIHPIHLLFPLYTSPSTTMHLPKYC
ncbi:hypothetical protein EV368DRAFT_83909 [Lentinula lateritia]|nr:hypothetical protein EV368DRAFT_83909 [Lentinula lateritia]